MISIIICSIDDQRFAQVSAQYARALADTPYEIIRINNARSLCEGYNLGLTHARGETLIFSHDDIEFLEGGLGRKLQAHLSRFDLIGVAGTTKVVNASWPTAGAPYIAGLVAHSAYLPDFKDGVMVYFYGIPYVAVPGMQMLDGLFLACHRKVALDLSWDEQTFDAFHGYDADFTFRAAQAGYRLAVVNDVYLYHHSGGNYNDTFDEYARRFQQKHEGKLTTVVTCGHKFGASLVRDKTAALVLMRDAVRPLAP